MSKTTFNALKENEMIREIEEYLNKRDFYILVFFVSVIFVGFTIWLIMNGETLKKYPSLSFLFLTDIIAFFTIPISYFEFDRKFSIGKEELSIRHLQAIDNDIKFKNRCKRYMTENGIEIITYNIYMKVRNLYLESIYRKDSLKIYEKKDNDKKIRNKFYNDLFDER